MFANLDAAITWHPGDLTQADTGSSLANYQVAYKFYGKSAHAGGAPHLGRSALDALELMNMGVQFLREHVVPEARIHYAITNTGGYSPNVVQPYAEVLYLIRAPKNSQVEEIYQRVNKIAEGAAHMTETRVEIDFVKGCSNLMSNKVIAKELWDNLVELGAPEYTEEEMKFAKAISEGVGDSRFESLEKIAKNCKDKAAKAEVLSHKGESMYRFVAPFNPDGIMSFGSTDVGDVSWNCPTAQAYVATWAAGTPGHSWQVVSQGKSGLAHKGLIYAAKAMAGAAIDMYEDPEIIAKELKAAKEAIEEKTGKKFDIVFCGKETTDFASGQVGTILAKELSAPVTADVVDITAGEGKVTVKQETEEGYCMIESGLPCVVAVNKPEYDPRYPTIKSKMAARKKPIEELAAEEAGAAQVEVLRVYAPAKRAAGVKIKAEDPAEAVSQALAMMSEAKAI